MRTKKEAAREAFDALCHDVEQFDDHPVLEGHGETFSERVPSFMKSYLVNWLRKFVADHGDTVRAALASVDDGPCKHEFEDWSNSTVQAPFNVCRSCGQVEGYDLRIGATVAEFREYTAKHART